MLPILEFILGGFWPDGFWRFIGAFVLWCVPFYFFAFCWCRFMRHLNIRKSGWPPPHCDADGDAYEE